MYLLLCLISELVYPGSNKLHLILQVWLEHISQSSWLFTAWNGTFSYLENKTLFSWSDDEEVIVTLWWCDRGRYWPFACECTTVDIEAHYSRNTDTTSFSLILCLSSVHSISFHHEHTKGVCTEKSLLAFTANKAAVSPRLTTFGCELVPKLLSWTNKETNQSTEENIFSQLHQSSFTVTCSIVKEPW